MAKYPMCGPQIRQMMRFRPTRKHRTDLVYYHGKPGTGKTTAVLRVIKKIKDMYPEVDYFCKMGGLDRSFDGYDNQKIVYIDDPVANAAVKTGDESSVQRLKNIISTGDTLVEIKGGTMVFDSSLIIITCNMAPRALANSCGIDNADAMYRRFVDTAGAYWISNREDTKRLTKHLIKVIQRNVKEIWDIDINAQQIYDTLPAVRNPTYDDIVF